MMHILAAGMALCGCYSAPHSDVFIDKTLSSPGGHKMEQSGPSPSLELQHHNIIFHSIESYMEVDNNDRGLSTSLYLCYIYLP